MLIFGHEFDNSELFEYAFPIDTWRIQIAYKLGYNSTYPLDVKIFLLDKCEDYNFNPCKVSAGLWYLGANALDVLLDRISGIPT